MAQESNVRVRTVTDPLALRALAHPLRLRLSGLIGREGSMTAADAARQLGISQALASHHLHQLEKYGFVERAEAPDERSRPWRLTATSMDIRPAEDEGRAATEVIQLHVAEQGVAQLQEWFGRRQEEDPRWTELSSATQSLLYLTVEEMEQFRRDLSDLIMPLAMSRPIGAAEVRPADALPVNFTLIAVPLPRTEHGG